MMHSAEIAVYPTPEELARNAARRFAGLAEKMTGANGRFTVALSGGSTPGRLFSLLAAPPFAPSLPWSSIFFFWGDERCVPPDHPDSNYRMAYESLFSKVPVPARNIFRIPAEDEDHDRAADSYSKTLEDFFGHPMPAIDLVLLGMGVDGHTASLFPGTRALHAIDRIAVANYVEKFDSYRITLTAETINNAGNVTFLVAGGDKAATLKEVLEGACQPEKYPSQLIRPKNGALLWMLDRAASASLTQTI
jgi:6-phosphogluconolactonase